MANQKFLIHYSDSQFILYMANKKSLKHICSLLSKSMFFYYWNYIPREKHTYLTQNLFRINCGDCMSLKLM